MVKACRTYVIYDGQRGGTWYRWSTRRWQCLWFIGKRFEPNITLCRPRFLSWFAHVNKHRRPVKFATRDMPEEFTLECTSKFRATVDLILGDSTCRETRQRSSLRNTTCDYTRTDSCLLRWRRVSRWWQFDECLSRWTSLSVHLDDKFSPICYNNKSNRNDGQKLMDVAGFALHSLRVLTV